MERTKLNPPHNIPRSGIIKFVGRDRVLLNLDQKLQQSERIAITSITGMSGIGKTELATQYSLKHQHLKKKTYPGGICWLNAREQNIGSQIVSFTRTKLDKNPPKYLETLEEKVNWCWTNWKSGKTLIIIDDVKNYKSIKPYLPPNEARFKILITTRNRHLEGSFQKLYLEILDEEQALELLESFIGKLRLKRELKQAKTICKKLGFLPLGLELVGRYLQRKPDLNLIEIKQTLNINDDSLKNISNEMTAKRGVNDAFELTWKELNKSEQKLGCLISLFALAPIPWSLIEKCLPKKNKNNLKKNRDKLFNLSLLQRKEKDIYQLHELIQEFFRDKQKKLANTDKQKSQLCTSIVKIAKEIPQTTTLSDINYLTPFTPHIIETINLYQNWLKNKDLIWPFIGISRFYESQGAYEQALTWRKQCISANKKRLGKKHPNTATSLDNLAVLYNNQGKYKKAKPLQLKALKIRKKLQHPGIVISLNNLASLYKSQGKYLKAEIFYLKALKLIKKLLGEEHPKVGINISNLAKLYHDQGRYREAEPLYLKVLKIRKKILREGHPDIITSLDNLALLYNNQGRYKEGEPLQIKALEMRKKLLGKKHPKTATSLNNLAVLYHAQNKYKKAEPLYLEALEMRKKILGEEHPDVAISLNNLAELYYDQDRYEEAEPLYLEALEMKKKILGEEHPDVAISLNNLAELYYDQDRYEEAEPLYLKAKKIRKKTQYTDIIINPNNQDQNKKKKFLLSNIKNLERLKLKISTADIEDLKMLETLEEEFNIENLKISEKSEQKFYKKNMKKLMISEACMMYPMHPSQRH